MKVVYINPDVNDVLPKKLEVLQYNGKNFIEFNQFENIEHVIEMALSLAKENEVLKERVLLLEEKLKLFENGR